MRRTCRSRSPAEQPRRRDVLPAGFRLGETRVLCVPGRAVSWSISLCRGEAIYQEEDCVRACWCDILKSLLFELLRLDAGIGAGSFFATFLSRLLSKIRVYISL